MSLTFERGYPWLLGLAAGLCSWLVNLVLPTSESYLTGLLSASISLSAILVGFLGTMKSIIMALPGVLLKLKEANYLDLFSSYLWQATLLNLLFCTLNLSGFFSWYEGNDAAFLVPWMGVGVAAILSFWRVATIMGLILKSDRMR